MAQVPLYVTFTYTAEEVASPPRGAEQQKDAGDAANTPIGSKGKSTSSEAGNSTNLKSFSFWTSVLLGEVVPRTLPAAHAAAGSSALVSGGGAAGGAASTRTVSAASAGEAARAGAGTRAA